MGWNKSGIKISFPDLMLRKKGLLCMNVKVWLRYCCYETRCHCQKMEWFLKNVNGGDVDINSFCTPFIIFWGVWYGGKLIQEYLSISGRSINNIHFHSLHTVFTFCKTYITLRGTKTRLGLVFIESHVRISCLCHMYRVNQNRNWSQLSRKGDSVVHIFGSYCAILIYTILFLHLVKKILSMYEENCCTGNLIKPLDFDSAFG